MQQTLGALRRTFVSIWQDGEPVRNEDWRIYSTAEQRENERRLESFVDALCRETPRMRAHDVTSGDSRQRLLEAFLGFACPALGWDRVRLDRLLEEFPPVIDTFRVEARRFDPSLSAADIYQGARNAITMLCLQRLLGVPVEITSAVLAYSLLYPYTDNLLDDRSVGAPEKRAFVERFGDRLAGQPVTAACRLEERVFALVAMIEGQYARTRYPHVFEALLAIHAAQARSVALLGSPTPAQVIETTVEKGGTSVLADGYLVAGTLTAAQAECLYGLGVILQLRDDLEDVQDDRRRGQQTAFSSVPWYRPLDLPTGRALTVGRAVIGRLAAFDHPSALVVRDLMKSSLLLTITDAAASAARRYRGAYREMLERHSPVRLGVLVKQRRRVSRAHASVSGLLETWVTSCEARAPLAARPGGGLGASPQGVTAVP